VLDVPLALALIAGAVAAFNPCGFALLPAYLTVLVVDQPGRGGQPAAAVRAVRFAVGMTVGFVAVFGAFGAVVAPLAVSIERWLPYVTVAIGVALVAFGGWTLTGRSVGLPGLAGRGTAPRATWASQVGYGITFALASLSCTVAPFLAVTAGAVRAGGVPGVIATFVAYAVGMGSVVLVLALAVATARTSLTAWMRRAGSAVSRLGGALLVVAGAYVAWYGWFELRVLAGDATGDPVVTAVTTVQAEVARVVVSLGPVGVTVLTLLGAAAAAAALLRTRTKRDEPVRSTHDER
jgi:cytochrome c-type biogenesis protein